MEVFILGVPQRKTEKSLNDFFENVLSGLHIGDWICQKKAQKPWAKLFFLNSEDGSRFLSLHGQTKDTLGHPISNPGSTNLMFKGALIYCSLSNRIDKFALRSLGMTKIARAERKIAPQKSEVSGSTKDSRSLACTSISCGLWDYVESELVFRHYMTIIKSATMTCNTRFIVFKIDTGQRLDIPYYSIEAVVWEGLPSPAMTFTLREAPRFFQPSSPIKSPKLNNLASIVASIFGGQDLLRDNRPKRYNGPERYRLPGMDEDHQEIAGSCLVYRFVLARESEIEDHMKDLGQTRGMPLMIRRYINVLPPENHILRSLPGYGTCCHPKSMLFPLA